MKYVLAILISISWSNTFSQKIAGVYIGEIISKRNALVLEMSKKEGRVFGSVYVSPYKHFDFVGSYDKPLLKGFIEFDTTKVQVEGSLKGNLLRLAFPDSIGKKGPVLYKVFTEADPDMEDLFSATHDMLLLGKWVSCKKMNPSGNDITEVVTMTHEFQTRGRGTSRLGNVPAMMSSPRGTVSTTSLHKDLFRWDTDWETHDGEIKITMQVMNREASQFDNYFFVNDTLVFRNQANGNLIFFKRK